MNQRPYFVVTITFVANGRVTGSQPWVFNGANAAEALASARQCRYLSIGRNDVLTVNGPFDRDDHFDNGCQ